MEGSRGTHEEALMKRPIAPPMLVLVFFTLVFLALSSFLLGHEYAYSTIAESQQMDGEQQSLVVCPEPRAVAEAAAAAAVECPPAVVCPEPHTDADAAECPPAVECPECPPPPPPPQQLAVRAGGVDQIDWAELLHESEPCASGISVLWVIKHVWGSALWSGFEIADAIGSNYPNASAC
jgi:hypothetical protein